MANAGMTPAQIAHYQEMPIWMTAVWTIGVWGAMLGSVLILLRNKLAFWSSLCHWRHFWSAWATPMS